MEVGVSCCYLYYRLCYCRWGGMMNGSKGNNQDNYQDDSYYQDDSQGVEMKGGDSYYDQSKKSHL